MARRALGIGNSGWLDGGEIECEDTTGGEVEGVATRVCDGDPGEDQETAGRVTMTPEDKERPAGSVEDLDQIAARVRREDATGRRDRDPRVQLVETAVVSRFVTEQPQFASARIEVTRSRRPFVRAEGPVNGIYARHVRM